jgi:hypothetical protein
MNEQELKFSPEKFSDKFFIFLSKILNFYRNVLKVCIFLFFDKKIFVLL